MPELRTDFNVFIPPSRAEQGTRKMNALMQAMQMENVLTQRETAVSTRKQKAEDRETNILFKMYEASKFSSPDILDALKKQFPGRDIKYEGEEVIFETPDFLIKMPSIIADEVVGAYKSNPELFTKEGMMTTGPILYKKGMTTFNKKAKKALAKEQLTIYGPKGKTKRVPVERGVEYVPPKEWSLKVPSKDQKTLERIEKEAEARAKGTKIGRGEKRLTQEQVNRRLSGIEQAKSSLSRGEVIDYDALAGQLPEDSITLLKIFSKRGDTDAAIAALNRERDFLIEKYNIKDIADPLGIR